MGSCETWAFPNSSRLSGLLTQYPPGLPRTAEPGQQGPGKGGTRDHHSASSRRRQGLLQMPLVGAPGSTWSSHKASSLVLLVTSHRTYASKTTELGNQKCQGPGDPSEQSPRT